MILPPIVDPPTNQKTPGAIVWHDLITTDLDIAKNFYGTLLGWQFGQVGDYTVIKNQSVPIGGMVAPEVDASTETSAGWIVYFSMDDIKDTAQWVASADGQLLRGPAMMESRGEYAFIADPTGAQSVLLNSDAGDPVKKQAGVGDWLWNELWTSDVEGALDFYQNLCTTAAQRVEKSEDIEYWVLISEEETYLGGIAEMPFDNMQSRWVPVIRVDDVEKIASQVSALGGRVLVTPDHPLTNGNVAVIRDPAGGIFMVEAWSYQED